MASGGIALVLEDRAGWSEYPSLSRKWISLLNAKVIDEADSVDERIKTIEIEGHQFWLSYDDNISAIHLEPKECESNAFVMTLKATLESRAQSVRNGD